MHSKQKYPFLTTRKKHRITHHTNIVVLPAFSTYCVSIAGNPLLWRSGPFCVQGKALTNQAHSKILKRKSVGNQKDNTGHLDIALAARYIEEGLKHYRSHAKARESGKRLAHSATFMVASIPGLCQSYFGLIQKSLIGQKRTTLQILTVNSHYQRSAWDGFNVGWINGRQWESNDQQPPGRLLRPLLCISHYLKLWRSDIPFIFFSHGGLLIWSR